MKRWFLVVLLGLFQLGAQSQVDITNGLIASYPFNGDVNDASGNNHHGQLQNGPQLVNDRFGNPASAYLFDGIDDYILVTDNGAFSTPQFSIVIWFQSQSDDLQNLIGKRDFITSSGSGGAQYQLFINYQQFPGIGSNLVGNNSNCSNISSSSYINTSDWICRTKWYCAVVTFDGSTHKIYIDGVLKKSAPTSFNSFLSCLSDIRFGNWWQGERLPFKGIMDDIRWYNRALNQQEVTALYGNFQNVNGQCSPTPGAGFLTQDTVCINTPLNINNMSIGASSYYWNFCIANSTTNPIGANLGGFGFNLPVFCDYAKDGNNYYAFITNNMPGKLVRLDFGPSLLNTPTVYNFGNLGGVIPDQCEGIQIVKNEGRWYALVVGGQPSGRIVKVDFGPSLANNSPTATNWGNIGQLSYPTDLHVFQDGSNWYGLTVNALTNSITRFHFTNSFSNTPTGTNLGNLGGLNFPTGIYAISKGSNWYAFITNAGSGSANSSNSSLTRLDFGNSLLNQPTGVNMGNPGNKLRSARDLTIYQSCNEVFGFVVNNSIGSDMVRLNFTNNLESFPSAISLGNTGNMSFPHSISKLFRVENDLYAFITNVDNNSITRLRFGGCSNASLSNSALQNPPPITYNQVGNYTINLTVDDGLPTQSAYCKTIVVVNNTHSPTQYKTICAGDSVLLNATKSSVNRWSTGSLDNAIYVKTEGTFWVESSVGGCLNVDSFIVKVNTVPIVNLGKDTLVCSRDSLVLNAGNQGANYLWNNGQNTQTLIAKQAGMYHVAVSNTNGCTVKDSIILSHLPSPVIQLSPDIEICDSDSATLVSSGADSFSWSPMTGLSNSTGPLAKASPSITTKYYMTATNNSGCTARDSVTVFVTERPVVNLGTDTVLCTLNSIVLDAGNIGQSFLWQNGDTSQTFNVRQAGLYHVSVNYQGCGAKDSILVSFMPSPAVHVNNDTTICESGNVVLSATGGNAYSWFPTTGISDPTSAVCIARPQQTTTYLVTVTGSNFCRTVDSVTITVNPKPEFTLSSSRNVLCLGDSASLTATGGDKYSWSPAALVSNLSGSSTLAFPTQTTPFQVVIEHHACNLKDSLSINLPVVDKPNTKVTKSNDINCFQGQATLRAIGSSRYLWQPSTGLSDSTSSNPVVMPIKSTTYHVSMTTIDGCEVKDSITVNVEKGDDGSGFQVPSAFTPNNDGKNDCFSVQHWGNVRDFSMNVYNRWGELVFHADDPSQCWNGYYKGILQSSDVYVYLIRAKTLCGDIFRKGTLALIK